MKALLLLVAGIYSFSLDVTAQTDLKTLTQNVSKAYKQKGGISMNFTYTYGDAQTNEVHESLNGTMKLEGNQKYLKYGELELIQGKFLTLVIDHEDKVMALDSSHSRTTTYDVGQMTLDSVEALFGDCTVSTLPDSRFKLSSNGDGLIHHSEIIVNARTFVVESIKVYYRYKPGGDAREFLEIKYHNIQLGMLKDQDFSIRKYYAKTAGNSWTQKPQYANYEEINHPNN